MSATSPDERPVIILLEEEADERAVLLEHLEQAGFAVVEVDDSDRALALLDETSEVRGFVADAHVPGRIDGFDLAGRIRRERPELAIILMSGHSDHTSGPVPDGVEFINKPNILEYLAPTLRRMIR
jgi:DNA-binding NtrC family response regulator